MKMMKMTKVKTIDYNHYKNNLKFVIIIIIDFFNRVCIKNKQFNNVFVKFTSP